MAPNQPWYKTLWNKGKRYFIAVATLVTTSFSASATTNKTETASASQAEQIEILQQTINDLDQEKYNGYQVNLADFSPEQVGHLFESGLDPCVTNGHKPLAQATYLGSYQMDINKTLAKFIDTSCQGHEKFDSLYLTKNQHGIRSNEFMEKWRELSSGENASEFEKEQLKFMFETHYKKQFNKLTSALPEIFSQITLDNYDTRENFVTSAAIMSCANQNPKRTFEIFLRAANEMCKEEIAKHGGRCAETFDINKTIAGDNEQYKQAIDNLTADYQINSTKAKELNPNFELIANAVSLATYDIKKKTFSSYGGRYDNEKHLLENIIRRFELVADINSLQDESRADITQPAPKTSFAFYNSDISRLTPPTLAEIRAKRALHLNKTSSNNSEITSSDKSYPKSKNHNKMPKLSIADMRKMRNRNLAKRS